MTKRAVKAALGLHRDTELAKFFRTTKQAVGRWQEDEPIPAGRQWQARAMRPDVFGNVSAEEQGVADAA